MRVARRARNPLSTLSSLVESPESFLTASWLDEIDWSRLGAGPVASRFVQYGVVWSNHVRLDSGLDVEFGFAPLSG
jgi:hypothetical protein